MIQPALPAPVSLLAVAPSPSGLGGEGGAFALSLESFLDAGEIGDAIPPGIPRSGPSAGEDRHDDADGGNIVPGDADPDMPAPDLALAWLAIPAAVIPAPRPIAFVPRSPIVPPIIPSIGDASIITRSITDVGGISPALTPATDLAAVADTPRENASRIANAIVSGHLPVFVDPLWPSPNASGTNRLIVGDIDRVGGGSPADGGGVGRPRPQALADVAIGVGAGHRRAGGRPAVTAR